MRLLLTALAIACATAPAAFAQAPAAADPVVLRVESGSVMVSQQGAEFVTVEADVSLQPQDRVLVPEGSAASLDYGQGCNVRLVTGASPVAASCPVTAGQPTAEAGTPTDAAAGGAGSSAGAGISTPAMVAGGVAAAAAIAIAVDSGSSSDDAPPISR